MGICNLFKGEVMSNSINLNSASQALIKTQAQLHQTASIIANANSANQESLPKDCVDLINNRAVTEALCKTIVVQKECTDNLIDLFA